MIVPFAPPAPVRTIGFAWRGTSGRAATFATLAQALVEGGDGPGKG